MVMCSLMSRYNQKQYGFLELSNYPILKDAGKQSFERAKLKAEKTYEIFRVEQDKHFVSDFDKTVKALKKPSTTNKKEPKE
jgi:hypothetical protein